MKIQLLFIIVEFINKIENYFNGYAVNLINYEEVMKCMYDLNHIYKMKLKRGKK